MCWQAYALSPAGPGYGGGGAGATSPVGGGGSGGGPGPGGGGPGAAAAEPFAADSPYFPFSTGGRGVAGARPSPVKSVQNRPLPGQTAAAALPPPAIRQNATTVPTAKDAPDGIVDGQHWVVSTLAIS